MEKKPFLTKDDVVRIRATVDGDYERDVSNLTGDTTDDLGPISRKTSDVGYRDHNQRTGIRRTGCTKSLNS